MIIDTHEAVERIVEAGASKKMAEAIVKSFNSSSENLASKADLLQVKTELKSEIAEIKVELKWIKAALFAILGLLVKLVFFN